MDNIRTHRILAYLEAAKTSSLKELMVKFGVSSATIHRDAAQLEKSGLVERVQGGLVYIGRVESGLSYQERVVANRAGKLAAARKALRLIKDGDILFLDSSTTVFELATLLVHRDFNNLTIATNAIPVMHLFRKFPPHWSLIGLGGDFDPQLNSLLGTETLAQLSRLGSTKAFVSALGFDGEAATTNHERQAELLRTVLSLASTSYLVIDATKRGRKGLYKFAVRDDFGEVVIGGM